MRNTLPKLPKKNKSGIVNLDSVEGRETHLMAYRKYGNEVQYFDSFGNLEPPKEPIQYLKYCKKKYNIDSYQQFNTYN